MSHSFYKILHMTSVLSVFMSLGALIILGKFKGAESAKLRKAASITHGVATTFILVSGFGMLARLGIQWPFPLWALIKVCLWLFIGASIALAKRKPNAWPILGIALIATAFFAAFLGNTKPF
jgi:hypothetical protein